MAVIDRHGSDTLGETPSSERPNVLIPAALFAAAWLVSAAATALHVAWVLPILMLLGTSSILRTGHTLLDRLVIATGAMAGMLIASGILFTFWPWGLDPVAVSGFCFSVLIAVGLVTRRRPSLPTRVRGTDLMIVAAPFLTWTLLHRPFGDKGFIASIPFSVRAHDAINHYTLFDAIHRIGGYQLLKHSAAAPYVSEMSNYQPGAHYLYVLLDVFRRSTTSPGTSAAEYTRYNQYEILGVCLLSLALPWAARWVAGAAVSGWRRALVVSVVAGMAVFGQLSTLLWNGFDAEAPGLALLAVTFAITARPPKNVREQIVVTGALLVALSFIYCLFLANAIFFIAMAYLSYRDRIIKAAPLAIVTAITVTGLALIPLAGSLTSHSVGGLFTEQGWFVDFSRPMSVAFGLIGAAAVLTRTGRRSPVWRISAATIVWSCFLAFAAEVGGRIRAGTAMYYSSKLVESAWVLSLVGFGAAALFLKDSPSRGKRILVVDKRGVSRRAGGEWLAGAIAVTLGFVVADGFPMSAHYPSPGLQPQTTSVTVAWAEGRVVSRWSPVLQTYAQAVRLDDSVPTYFVVSTEPRYNRFLTAFSAAFNHRTGSVDLDALGDLASPLGTKPDKAFVDLVQLPPGTTTLTPDQLADMHRVEAWIGTQPPNSRIVVGNEAFARLLQRFAADEPRLRLSVLYMRSQI